MSVIICPACKATGKLPGGSEGKRFRCPKCGEAVSIKAKGFGETTIGLDGPIEDVEEVQEVRSRKRKPAPMGPLAWVIIASATLLVTASIIGVFVIIVSRHAVPVEQPKVIAITLDELLREANENPAAVVLKYENAVVETTGRVLQVDIGEFVPSIGITADELPIGLRNKKLTLSINRKTVADQLAKYPIGSSIKVRFTGLHAGGSWARGDLVKILP